MGGLALAGRLMLLVRQKRFGPTSAPAGRAASQHVNQVTSTRMVIGVLTLALATPHASLSAEEGFVGGAAGPAVRRRSAVQCR
jgi:hypothetical protein